MFGPVVEPLLDLVLATDFFRSFPLPDSIDQDKIEAHFDNGILNVVLPKTEEAQPKRIEVKVN